MKIVLAIIGIVCCALAFVVPFEYKGFMAAAGIIVGGLSITTLGEK